MTRGFGRAQRHVLKRLQGGGKLTVAQLVEGYSAGGVPTAAEYEAVRRAAATLADLGLIGYYVGQLYRPGKGGWYSLERSADRTFPTHSQYRP